MGAFVPLPNRPPLPSGTPDIGRCWEGPGPPTFHTAPALTTLFPLGEAGDNGEPDERWTLIVLSTLYGTTLLTVKGSGFAPSVRDMRSSGESSLGSLFIRKDLVRPSSALLEGMKRSEVPAIVSGVPAALIVLLFGGVVSPEGANGLGESGKGIDSATLEPSTSGVFGPVTASTEGV